jgi:hypothetical protein
MEQDASLLTHEPCPAKYKARLSTLASTNKAANEYNDTDRHTRVSRQPATDLDETATELAPPNATGSGIHTLG